MLRELKTLLPYFWKYKNRYLAGFLCLAVASGGQMALPQILKQAVDIMTGGSFTKDDIARLFIALLIIALFISLARFGWRYFIHGSSRRIETELRSRLFRHLLGLSAGFFAQQKTGELMARATNDMFAVRMASGMALVALIDGIFMSVTILVIMFRQASRLALFTVLPLPLITLLIIFLGTLVGKKYKHVQDVFASLSALTQESITGIRVIKSFVKEDYFLAKFGKENEAYLRANMDLVRLWGFFHPGVTFLSGLTGVLLLYLGGVAVLEGRLTPGLLVALFSYLEMLIWPMIGAGFTVNMLQRGAAAMGRINAVLREKPAIVSRPHARAESPAGDIEVRSLFFDYTAGSADCNTTSNTPGNTPAKAQRHILADVSFELPQGKTLGILGRTGSGKTSLVSLLPRIYDPPPGTIFIGGVDILDYELSALRKTFGIVPQDTFLFSRTLRRNIAFGAEKELTENAITALADASTISRDARGFPQGLETPIGERGLTLSGGQKQRVAISRALAADSKILIFDDALSAVDTETEEHILARVLEERRGKTNIIISHRIRALSFCHSIIVLDAGRIVQKGSHSELLKEDGLYKDIYTLQTTGHTETARDPLTKENP